MSTVVISHGYGADHDSVWFPYARTALEARGHRVHVPDLPGSDAPEPDAWLAALRAATDGTDPAGTVLVGHSVGGINVLRLLQAHDGAPFAGAVLVATPAELPAGYESLAGFFAEPFDWSRLRRAAHRYRVLTAVDDPVLLPDPARHVRDLVVGLHATATLTPSGAHYGATPDDHLDLPEAVDLVLDCVPVS